jgi:hypothetical protein
MNAPFTDDEVRAALGLVLLQPHGDPISSETDRAIGWSYTEDTLILLSLRSSELAERVRVYRDARGALPPPGTAAEQAWTNRREYFKSLIKQT